MLETPWHKDALCQGGYSHPESSEDRIALFSNLVARLRCRQYGARAKALLLFANCRHTNNETISVNYLALSKWLRRGGPRCLDGT